RTQRRTPSNLSESLSLTHSVTHHPLSPSLTQSRNFLSQALTASDSDGPTPPSSSKSFSFTAPLGPRHRNLSPTLHYLYGLHRPASVSLSHCSGLRRSMPPLPLSCILGLCLLLIVSLTLSLS
ncbi:hypothetical protein TorRG33x02_351860, partial [Trema orientale]